MVNITDSMSVQFIFLMFHNNTAGSNRNWIHFLHRIRLYALGSMGSRGIAEFVVEVCRMVSPEMFDQNECLIHWNSFKHSPMFKEKAQWSKILVSQNALECWGKPTAHETLTVNAGYRWILGTVGRVVSKLCLEIGIWILLCASPVFLYWTMNPASNFIPGIQRQSQERYLTASRSNDVGKPTQVLPPGLYNR